jgi:hypothetical protein
MKELAAALQGQIANLEQQILQRPQVDCPMLHWIDGPYYYRAILVRKDTLITGAKHRLEHECVSIGDIQVSTDLGMKRLTGYHRFWADAGKKRVGLALEDTIWVTIHWTNQPTVEGIEEWLSYPEEHKALAAVRARRNSRTLQASNLPELQIDTEVQL